MVRRAVRGAHFDAPVQAVSHHRRSQGWRMVLFVFGSLLAVLILAAAWDVVERGRRDQRRSARAMAATRHDLLADVWAVQHHGSIPTPLGTMMKDPGTPPRD